MTDFTGLAEPFDRSLLRTNSHKGNLTYVPVSEVIARLNSVLGVDGWEYEIIRLWEAGEIETKTGVYPKWVMAHVRLHFVRPKAETWRPESLLVSRDGVGGQEVKLLKSGDGVVDLGDEYKGAVSDALKKAAQSLGVGLDLARTDEALRWEQAQEPDEAACPKCGEVVPGALSEREPMRAHMVATHDYTRNDDGTVSPPAEAVAPVEVESAPGTRPCRICEVVLTADERTGHMVDEHSWTLLPDGTVTPPVRENPARKLREQVAGAKS